jgi:hypothetical protein
MELILIILLIVILGGGGLIMRLLGIALNLFAIVALVIGSLVLVGIIAAFL